MQKQVTVRDIADAAGVSHSSVLRVLNGRPAAVRVSIGTRDRILAIVRQSGYRPNRIASDMAMGRRTTLGLVLAPGGPDASAMHLAAVEALLAAAGYRLTLIVLPVDPASARDRVTALLHDGVAGLICAPGAMAVAAQAVAGSCPLIALGQGAGETILKALGVAIPKSEPLLMEGGALSPPALEPVIIEPVPVAPVPPPITAATPPGSDDPCPCGSGKKYKKCHGKWPSAPITNNQPPITAATPPDDPCPCGSGKKYKKCHGKWGAGQTVGTIPPAPVTSPPPATSNQEPITAATPPDDPCPCGSGKKYKKCHGKWGAGR